MIVIHICYADHLMQQNFFFFLERRCLELALTVCIFSVLLCERAPKGKGVDFAHFTALVYGNFANTAIFWPHEFKHEPYLHCNNVLSF